MATNARIIPKTVRSHKKKSVVITPDPFPSCKKWVKVGKPATIFYKKFPDDMILITGFENFLSLDEIKAKYGSAVMKVYFAFPCHMLRYTDGVRLSGFKTGSIANIEIGQLFNKQEFSKIIAHVKKCGGLLHDIILAYDKGEIKRIEI